MSQTDMISLSLIWILQYIVTLSVYLMLVLEQRCPTRGTREISRGTPDLHQIRIYTKIFNENAIKCLHMTHKARPEKSITDREKNIMNRDFYYRFQYTSEVFYLKNQNNWWGNQKLLISPIFWLDIKAMRIGNSFGISNSFAKMYRLSGK